MKTLKKAISRLLKRDGVGSMLHEIENQRGEQDLASLDELKRRAPDLPAWQIDIIAQAYPYTMTGLNRLSVLIEAVCYVEENSVHGDIVECGVWRGGSMVAAAKTLQHLNRRRRLWLYDTFSGMSPPTKEDATYYGIHADEVYDKVRSQKEGSEWCKATLEDVVEVMNRSGYDSSQVSYVKGKVEDTIPASLPERISILRLDTDFYESTKHELLHLYELVVPGGIVIIDDYGYWKGARKAVDEFLEGIPDRIFMTRIDSSGRVFVKPA